MTMSTAAQETVLRSRSVSLSMSKDASKNLEGIESCRPPLKLGKDRENLVGRRIRKEFKVGM